MGKLAHVFLSSEFPTEWNVIQEQLIAVLDTEDNSSK